MNLLKACTILVCFLFVQVAITEAQVVTITGTVVDSSGTPLPSANILLLTTSDSSLVKGAVTDNSGVFRLDNIASGTYHLSVSMVGFQKHVTGSFAVNRETVRMAPIRLKESVEQLDEVAVTARRPLFEQQIDRLVVNVQRSITSSGSSVLEVLEKSPGIQINRQNGNISMNGKSGVRVMINDKVMRLSTDAVVQMLNGMNSANVEQIELITTPPAKYEAEGDAGIINIRMKELAEAGSTGTVGGGLGYNKGEIVSGNFSYSRRSKKFSYFINYSINHDQNEHATQNKRYLQQNGFTEFVGNSSLRKPTINIQNLRLGMEYNLTSKTTAGMLLTGYRRLWEMSARNNITNRMGPDSTLVTEMMVNETNHWRKALVNVSLDHSFSDKQSIGFDLDYLYYKRDNPSDYKNRFQEGDRTLMENQGFDVELETPINFWVGKIDYWQQLNESFTLETGLKGTWSNFINDVHVSENTGDSWAVNNRYTNKADLTEKVGMAYLSVNGALAEDVQINGGLRYEYTDSYLSTPDQLELVDRSNGYLFPSLFAKKEFTEKNSLSASYTRRITRPTFTDMAPFVLFITPETFISGNSSLKPAISNSIKLDYQRDPWLVSLQYTYTQNEISSFQPELDTETNTQIYRAENLDFLRTYALTTNLPIELAAWWKIQTSLSGRYQVFKTGHLNPNVTQDIAGLTANVTNSFDLPYELALEISGYYQSKAIWGLQEFRPQGSVNAGIQKRISDGQGILRLSMDDIFYTDVWRMKMDVPRANLDSFFKYDRHMQSIRLTFTWNFGNNDVDAVNIEAGSSEEQSRVNTN